MEKINVAYKLALRLTEINTKLICGYLTFQGQRERNNFKI